ncbi:replication initiation negative regulator SeqA [Shewanella benthica]|uniref:Negative modulator of initiation of replication n=1 Tax=Shewanella benthica KT99 TaxID=314608 RepID=A9DM41_9GAMM|nr:replication initiation negative regulator SeqA [Shewanella benthica]EDP98761.1 seqA protein [Shewanella benthica KT99]
MKYIEVDEELYRHIAGKTERIGESASDILRRLLGLDVESINHDMPATISHLGMESVAAKPQVKVQTGHQPQSNKDFSECIDTEELAAQKGAVGRFLFILEAVYRAAPEQFSQVLQIQGRDRLYFATSRESLLKASKSANPKEIGQSGFWVITNNNTAKKRNILTEVLQQYGTVEAKIEAITNKL